MTPKELAKDAFKQISDAMDRLNIKDPYKVFKKFDKDGNDKITKYELEQGFKQMRFTYSEDQIDAMWEQLDKDNNGTIDINEFSKAVKMRF